MADRSLIELTVESEESERAWDKLPRDCEGFLPMLKKLGKPHDAKYTFAHKTKDPVKLSSQGYANEFALAVYNALLQQRGKALSAEVVTTSKYRSPDALKHVISQLPVDQGVREDTTFSLQIDATELTEVRSHMLSLPPKWDKHPFEDVILMVLRPGESLDLSVKVVEGVEGQGAHALATSVGMSVESIRGPGKTPEERRALVGYRAGIVRLSTPSQMRPKTLVQRCIKSMELYLQRLKPEAVRTADETFLVSIPEGPDGAGVPMLLARIVHNLYEDTPYVAPSPDAQAIIIGAKSEGAAITKIERAAKALAAVAGGILKKL